MAKQFQTNKVNVDYRKFQLTALTMDFVVETPADVLNEGVAVSLTAAGLVKPLGQGEFPFGYVTTKYDPDQSLPPSENRATIQVVGQDVVAAISADVLPIGTLVVQDGPWAADTNFGMYDVAASTNYANGIVIKGAAAGNEPIEVLLFNSPVYVP